MNTQISASHVRKRILKLEDANLLKKTDDPRGYYRLSGLGHRYLTGELKEKEGEQISQATDHG